MIEFIAGFENEELNMREDLFNAKNLLGDDTQRVLLPFLRSTEQLILNVVKKYDSFGDVKIFPALDLGIPNNKVRLAGGFATGMMFLWECKRKLAFVDTTMNVCSSSYYELNEIEDIKEFFNIDKIDSILQEAKQRNYLFDLTSGNHFLMLCKSEHKGKYFLVMHFSDMGAKNIVDGLYPSENIWYSKKLKTYVAENGRYIRYLIDDDAEKFYEKVKILKNRNELMHNWLANEFCKNKIISGHIYHHYGMPKDNIAIIGTYLSKKDDIVPIFTNTGYPIYLFKPMPQMWHILLNKEEFYLIPHGWGQEVANLNASTYLPYFEVHKNFLRLVNEEQYYDFKLDDSLHFPDKFSEIRKLNCYNYFERYKNYLNGQLVDTLEQKAVYCKKYNKVKYYE